jgi:hypothetical protein
MRRAGTNLQQAAYVFSRRTRQQPRLVGLVVGVLPALRAMRLRVVDALAGW